MAKDASLFTWLDEAKERKIYVVYEFSLDIVGQVDVTCRHVRIFDVYHGPSLSADLFSIAQLTQTCNIVEFWPDRFYVRDLKKGNLIVIEGILDPNDNLYKLYDMT
jgi:hypothetical protein